MCYSEFRPLESTFNFIAMHQPIDNSSERSNLVRPSGFMFEIYYLLLLLWHHICQVNLPHKHTEISKRITHNFCQFFHLILILCVKKGFIPESVLYKPIESLC